MKDGYVSRFIHLCSFYDRLNDMRKRVNKMVKNRDYKATKTSEISDKNLAKIKNGAIGTLENFERLVKTIDM